MKHFYTGIVGTFLVAWTVQVLVPYTSMGKLEPMVDADTGEIYPVNISGLAAQGARVYAANGCVSCHTQQARSPYMGADIARKWASRRSVARDYMYENENFLGTLRMGPDLSGVGAWDVAKTGEADLSTTAVRQKTAAWHYKHLYNPRLVNPKSFMPGFPWLFKEIPIKGEMSGHALALAGEFSPQKGNQIVPSHEAEALVAYLLSLNKNHSLPEAKVAVAEVAAK